MKLPYNMVYFVLFLNQLISFSAEITSIDNNDNNNTVLDELLNSTQTNQYLTFLDEFSNFVDHLDSVSSESNLNASLAKMVNDLNESNQMTGMDYSKCIQGNLDYLSKLGGFQVIEDSRVNNTIQQLAQKTQNIIQNLNYIIESQNKTSQRRILKKRNPDDEANSDLDQKMNDFLDDINTIINEFKENGNHEALNQHSVPIEAQNESNRTLRDDLVLKDDDGDSDDEGNDTTRDQKLDKFKGNPIKMKDNLIQVENFIQGQNFSQNSVNAIANETFPANSEAVSGNNESLSANREFLSADSESLSANNESLPVNNEPVLGQFESESQELAPSSNNNNTGDNSKTQIVHEDHNNDTNASNSQTIKGMPQEDLSFILESLTRNYNLNVSYTYKEDDFPDPYLDETLDQIESNKYSKSFGNIIDIDLSEENDATDSDTSSMSNAQSFHIIDLITSKTSSNHDSKAEIDYDADDYFLSMVNNYILEPNNVIYKLQQMVSKTGFIEQNKTNRQLSNHDQ